MDQFKLSVDDVLYSDLTDAQLLAMLKIKALTAQLEQLPSEKQIARFVSVKTIKNISNLDPTLIELETNSVLTQVELVIKKRGYSKTKMRQLREKPEDVTGKLPDCYQSLKEKKRKEKKKDTIVSKKSVYGEFKKVLLTNEEHEKLLEQFGDTKTNEYIQRLDIYIGSKGAKYTSHYLTILSWSRKDKKENGNCENSIEAILENNRKFDALREWAFNGAK